MLDRVTHRSKMKDELVTILRMLGGLPPAVVADLPAPTAEETAAPEADASASDES
jgi:acetyl-CoA carboxylase carboxyl transferase subunit beta